MGFIKIDRKITSHWLWEDKPFAKGQAWIDLLLLATWKENKELYRGQLVQRQPGEIACSIKWLAERWGWNRKTVAAFLDLLEADNMLAQKRTTQGTTLTVENWALYQSRGQRNGQQNGQQTGQQTGQRWDNDGTHHKKVKERKESSKKGKEEKGLPTLKHPEWA